MNTFGQLYAALEPYLVQLAGAILVWIVSWFAFQVKRWIGLTITAAQESTLEQTASNAATHALAKLQGPINTLAIDIKSPVVTEAVNYLFSHANEAVIYAQQNFGFTPEMFRELVLAKLGEAQVLSGSPHNEMVNPKTLALTSGPRPN